ncbi:MAG: hypothetical protein B6242_07405 [Anaerolineaceae bacterium 4572_78]|nr:MAG: hypothetical protein B6242_07405 [Anaerolineaceae bacterium 4572_78]
MPAPTPIPITTTVELEEFYSTPQLLYPEMNEIFIHGNTIELRWKPVGELAENEYYAVRLNYMYQGQPADGGKNTNETTWTIPLNIDRPADGPGFNYTWYVYVERTIDGNPIPVSHESEHRQFTWER